MSGLVEQEAELLVLPPGTVLLGPEWDEECYQKGGDTDEWWAPGQEVSWTSRSLLSRGPFTVLHVGGEYPISPGQRP